MAVCPSRALNKAAYERHRTETTLLFSILQEHWLSCLCEAEAADGELPAFVRDEFAAYFRCGIPPHGYADPPCPDW